MKLSGFDNAKVNQSVKKDLQFYFFDKFALHFI